MTEQSFLQLVPRPSSYAIGAPPPWAGSYKGSVPPIPADEVRHALVGLEPADRRGGRAAVLVPLVARDTGCSVILIRRATELRHDPRHVAFPGGHVETDESDESAALRETEEEIGLSRELVEILGELPVVERARDNQRVTPVVGIVRTPFSLVANPTEVEAILEVPLARLLSKGCAWQEEWARGPGGRIVRFFADEEVLGHDLVWGLTAQILWDLLERLTTL